MIARDAVPDPKLDPGREVPEYARWTAPNRRHGR
jgi:hypothetical protein